MQTEARVINETAIEQILLDRINAEDVRALYAAIAPGKDWFYDLMTVGMFDIDETNIREFVRTVPACLVSYSGENASDLDNAGTSSRLSMAYTVYVVVRSVESPGDMSGETAYLTMAVKQALRGAKIRTDDGMLDVRYVRSSQRARLGESGLSIRAVEFTVTVYDHPLQVQ